MPEVRTYKCYSHAELRAGAGGRVFDVHEPFRGQLCAKVAVGGRDDARIAVQGAVDALPTHGFYACAGFAFSLEDRWF